MKNFDYDLFVLGAGSGGVRASRVASSYGAKVGICEEDRVGGTCVIRGCIPKKLLVYASEYFEELEDSKAYGWNIDINSFSWSNLINNKDIEIDRLNEIYKKILSSNNVKLFENKGVFVDNHTLKVGDKTITADKILISTGGLPFLPNISGINNVITSNEAFHLEKIPKKIIINGGGYIAVEFASIFNGLGSEVTIIYRGDQILKGFDFQLRNFLAEEIKKKGIKLFTSQEIVSIEESDSKKIVKTNNDLKIETDVVMFATGRIPNTRNLGLENIGVRMNGKGAVIVDSNHKTNISNIYAIGDVTDRFNLTPVALNEGICFADTVFGNKNNLMDYSMVPTAVFSLPNVATVGLTEEEAKEKYTDVDIYQSSFRSLKHTLTNRNELTFMKIVVDSQSQKVLGFHMVGSEAGEIIQGLAVSLKIGVTKDQLDSVLGIHPSAAEEFVTMRTKIS